MKKKIGVVCDNYKIIEYSNALMHYELTFSYHSLGFVAITFFVDEKDFEKETKIITEILTRIELEFKARKN